MGEDDLPLWRCIFILCCVDKPDSYKEIGDGK